MKNPYVLAFSAGAFLYVGVEAAVYVWMPTLLAGYTGPAAALAAYSISIFFLLRAAGRFLGAWMLTRFQLAVRAGAVQRHASSLCFVAQRAGGVAWAVYLLPLSGLFMSVIYPTINSKGISCLPRSEHGAGAGVILFFTCVSAVLAPLAIGAVSDAFGGISTASRWRRDSPRCSSSAACSTGCSIRRAAVLERLDVSEYHQAI